MDGVTREVIKDDSIPGGPVTRFNFPGWPLNLSAG